MAIPGASDSAEGALQAPGHRVTWAAIGACSAIGLFLLSHPYGGIVHDAELYVGRALADLDPGGLGRDILFAHDGQSAFSLYPRLSGAWIRAVGPDLGVLTITLAGLLAWFGALAAFAAGFARGRLLWACLVAVAVVPSFYGQLFRYGEPFATARLPAETLVLAGLAAILAGRAMLALAALLLAAAVHPIMAAPALAVWAVVQAARDRRWILLPVGGLAALLAAAASGLPVAERLFRLVEPDWAEALAVNAYLFPSTWPTTSWAEIAVRAATVLLAVRFVHGRTGRSLLVAILVVGACGVGLASLAADRWLVLLVTQAQPWRAVWLVALAGALTFPIAAIGLWQSGRSGRVALACLVFGWLAAPISWVGAFGGALALMIAAADARRAIPFTRRAEIATWLAVGGFAALCLAQRAVFLGHIIATRPPGAPVLDHVWQLWIPGIPLSAVAILIASRPDWRIGRTAAAAAAVVLLSAAAMLWDQRSPLGRILDRHAADPELARLLPDGRGEILWLKNGAGFVWKLTGRPSWASYPQGAGIVFSPELGRVWLDRMERLVAAGLADEADRRPWGGFPHRVLRPTRAALDALCAAPDGPVAIVVPLDGSVTLPDGLPFRTYVLPVPDHALRERDGTLGWQPAGAQAVVDCTAERQAAALRGTLPG